MKLRIKEDKYKGKSSYFIEIFSKYKKYGFWKITEKEEWTLLWEYSGDKYNYNGLETRVSWKPVIFENIYDAEEFVLKNYSSEDDTEVIIHDVNIKK